MTFPLSLAAQLAPRHLLAAFLFAHVTACVGDLEEDTTLSATDLNLRPYPRDPNQAVAVAPSEQQPIQPSEPERPASTGKNPDAKPPALDSGTDAPPAADDDEPAEPAKPTVPEACGDVPKDIFGDPKKCGTSNCHGSPDEAPSGALGAKTDLGFSTDDVFQRLEGLELNDGLCKGQLVIDPDDIAASLLLTKLDAKPPCGFVMPMAAPGVSLSDSDKACIRAWLIAEAEEAK